MLDGSFGGDKRESATEQPLDHEVTHTSARSLEQEADLRLAQEARYRTLLERSRDNPPSIAALSLPELMQRREKFSKILSELLWSERGWRTYYKEQIQEMERHISQRLEDRVRHQIQIRDSQARTPVDLAELQNGEQELAALAAAETLEQKKIPMWKFWLWPVRAQLALSAEAHTREQQALLTNIDALNTITDGK